MLVQCLPAVQALAPAPRFHLTRDAGMLASNAALRAEVCRVEHGPSVAKTAHAKSCSASASARRRRVCSREKRQKDRRRGTGYRFAAGLFRGVIAVEVLVGMHYAGKLRLVEIATEAATITRIIRDERRWRGEPASGLRRVRGRSRFGAGHRVTVRDVARAKRTALRRSAARVWERDDHEGKTLAEAMPRSVRASITDRDGRKSTECRKD